MFKKSNKARNIRKKTTEEDEAPSTEKMEEDFAPDSTTSTPVVAPSTPSATPSVKSTPATPKVLLSFDEEMDATPKEASGRKLLRDDLLKVSPMNSAPSHSVASSPAYTPERLDELRKVSFSTKSKSTPLSSKTTTVDLTPGSAEKAIIIDDDEPHDVKNMIDIEKMEEKEDEEDEEYQRWEIDQIKKGGGKVDKLQPKKKSTVPKISISSMVAPKVSVEDVLKKLNSSLYILERNHQQHRQELASIDSNSENILSNLESLKKKHQQSSELYMYFREWKDYIRDLCDCVGQKMLTIDTLESDLFQIMVRGHGASPELSPQDLLTERASFIEKSQELFSDTISDFSTVKAIKAKFEEWKFKYPDTYRQCYCSISVLNIFSPFVRLEILNWIPLFCFHSQFQHEELDQPYSFEGMTWYKELYNYGINKDSEEIDENDDDLNLVPNLIAKAIVPRVTSIFTHFFDPLDKVHMKRAQNMLHLLLTYLEPNGEQMKELALVIRATFQTAVDDLVSYKDKDAPRQLEKAAMLFEHISLCKDVISMEILMKMAVDQLLNMKMLPLLNQLFENTTLVMNILTILDASIVRIQVPNKMKLGLFSLFLNSFAQKQASDVAKIEIVARMMNRIGDSEQAQKLAKNFKFNL